MNQRRKPKDPAQDAAPSDQTLILKPGSGEDPTVALDARATLALKGEEARRMQEATQAMPLQQVPDTPTQGLPLQPSPAEEPTVALRIGPSTQLPDPLAGPPKVESQAGISTQQVRLEDIAWVAGEAPGEPEPPQPERESADPTSRMKVSRAELSRLVEEKGAALASVPESRRTAKLPPAAERAAAADSTSRLSSAEAEQALAEGETAAGADRTLILPPPQPEAATSLLPQQEPPGSSAIPRTPDSSADQGTAPILKPARVPASATAPDSGLAAPAPADATLILKPGSQDGTVPIQRPALGSETSTALLPQVEPAPEPIAEPAPPAQWAMVAPNPAAAAAPVRPQAVGPGGTVPVLRAELPESPPPSRPTGPGGTVQLMRSETPEPVQPAAGAVAPVAAGGTVPVMRSALPEARTPEARTPEARTPEARTPEARTPEARTPVAPPPLAASTQVMPQQAAAAPSPEPVPSAAPATQLMPKQETASAAPVPPAASAAPVPSPASTRPVSTEPVAQGTLLVPVEELSRLSEVAEAPAATAFSTQLMPPQAPAAAPSVRPPARPDATVHSAGAAAAAKSTGPLPVQGKRPWKLWAGLAGLAALGSAGVALWLRPDLFGLGAGAVRLVPRPGGEAATRAVPAALKATKDKADAGDAGAMRYLGTCYANGLGVPRDVEEAKRWYRRAAEAGSQAAREELANLQRQER